MLTVGICDDESIVRQSIRGKCAGYLKEEGEDSNFVEFSSGEEVLEFIHQQDSQTIDILFLDIEMSGIDGITLRDRLLPSSKIMRIVFVTSHTEQMQFAFGLKTIGFLQKPVPTEGIIRKLEQVRQEKLNTSLFRLPTAEHSERYIRTELIYYIEADGNYSHIFYHDETKNEIVSELVVMQIGALELELQKKDFIRVHKSYLVNLVHVLSLSDTVSFLDLEQTLTVGRKYKTTAREAYMRFVARKARERF